MELGNLVSQNQSPVVYNRKIISIFRDPDAKAGKLASPFLRVCAKYLLAEGHRGAAQRKNFRKTWITGQSLKNEVHAVRCNVPGLSCPLGVP